MIRAMTEPSKLSHSAAPDHQPVAGGIAARARATATGGARYLDGLNPEQREAVETLDGPVLVLGDACMGHFVGLSHRESHFPHDGTARR